MKIDMTGIFKEIWGGVSYLFSVAEGIVLFKLFFAGLLLLVFLTFRLFGSANRKI